MECRSITGARTAQNPLSAYRKSPSPPARAERGVAVLLQRRERGRQHDHVFLLQHAARRAALWRPDAFAPRLVAHGKPLGGILIAPDVHPEIEVAQFGV